MKKILALSILIFLNLTTLLKAQVVSYPLSYPVANPTVIITELYPSPDSSKGDEEWIEIFNYGNQDLNLKGMYLKERASNGNGYASTISNLPDDIIKSRGYYLIKGTLLKVSLNNSGDEITLFDGSNQIVDTIKYDSITNGISYARVFESSINNYSEEFLQDSILTPLEENRFPVPAEKVYIDILSAKAKSAGTVVNISGTVTVEKDLLGDTEFYIQDSTGGIKVDLYSGVEFSPELGQNLKLTGVVSESSGEKKLVIKRVEDITSNGASTPLAAKKLTDGINLDSKLGMLVYTEGSIMNNYSTSFDIDSVSGLIRVSILSSTGINIPEKAKDDIVHAAGILVKVSGVYKILPRYQPDLEILPASPQPPSDSLVKASNSKPKANSPSVKSVATSNLNADTILASSTSNLSTLTLPSTTIYKLPYSEDDTFTIELWPIFVVVLFCEGIFILWKNREQINNLYLAHFKEILKQYFNFSFRS